MALVVMSVPMRAFARGAIASPPKQTIVPIPVPIQNYAVLDISDNITREDNGPHDVTMISLDDGNNAAFAFTSSIPAFPGLIDVWLDFPPATVHAYPWFNGMLGAEKWTDLTNCPAPGTGGIDYTYNYALAYPELLDSAGKVYGYIFYGFAEDPYTIYDSTQGQTSTIFSCDNNSYSLIVLPSPYVGLVDPTAGAHGPSYVASHGYLAGAVNTLTLDFSVAGGTQQITPLSLPLTVLNNTFTVFDGSTDYSQAANIAYNLSIDPVDFTPAAVNNNGVCIGSDSYGNNFLCFGGTLGYRVALPADAPADLNDQNQVVLEEPSGEGYLWEAGVLSVLATEGPQNGLQNSVFGIQPFSISAQAVPAPAPGLSSPPSAPPDQTIHILAAAQNREDTDPSTGVVPAETFIWNRDNAMHWTFGKVGLPPGTSITEYDSVNANGIIAAIGKPAQSTPTNHALLLLPVTLTNKADPTKRNGANGNDKQIELMSSSTGTDINAVAWIAASDTTQAQVATGVYPPRMPALVASAGNISGLTYCWKLKVIFHGQNNPSNNYRDFDPSATLTNAQIAQLTNVNETGSVGYSDDIDDPLPTGSADSNVVTGWMQITNGSPWNIYQDPDWQAAVARGFFGGDAELSLMILDSNGNTIMPEQDYYFRIAGENPDPAVCQTYINTKYNGPTQNWTGLTYTHGSIPPAVPGYWFAYAIAKEETEGDGGRTCYNNFMDNGGQLSKKTQAWPGHEGRPDWNNDDLGGKPQYGTGGYGLFQLTYQGANPDNPAEPNFIMPRDWIWNWQSNVQQFSSKMREKLQQEQSSLDTSCTKLGASFTDPSNLTVTKDGVTFNFWEATVITRNNGGKGWYPKLTKTHTDWGTYKPAGSSGYLYEVAHKGINNNP